MAAQHRAVPAFGLVRRAGHSSSAAQRAGLAALSLAVELVQSLGLLGAPDPADRVANSLGAALGAGAAALAMRAGLVVHDRQRTSGRTVVATAIAVLLIVTGGWLGAVAGADARRDVLTRQLRQAFAETTAAEIGAQIESDNGVAELLSAVSTQPGYLGRVGESEQFEGRYSVQFLGLDRCVFIRWNASGFTMRDGSGGECTVFRERPPTT